MTIIFRTSAFPIIFQRAQVKEIQGKRTYTETSYTYLGKTASYAVTPLNTIGLLSLTLYITGLCRI